MVKKRNGRYKRKEKSVTKTMRRERMVIGE